MDEQNHEESSSKQESGPQSRHEEHAEHPGCKCGGVCRITGDCGKHELKGEGEAALEGSEERELEK